MARRIKRASIRKANTVRASMVRKSMVRKSMVRASMAQKVIMVAKVDGLATVFGALPS